MPLLIVLLLLALQLGYSAASCKFRSVNEIRDHDSLDQTIVGYVDCLSAPTKGKLATCLLQTNSIARVMDCTDKGPHKVLFWWLEGRGDPADGLDLIPRSDRCSAAYSDTTDGKLRVTPRGILLEAAKACKSCDKMLARSIAQCPYDTWEKFRGCLCCE